MATRPARRIAPYAQDTLGDQRERSVTVLCNTSGGTDTLGASSVGMGLAIQRA
jgi:hypothetical protein